MTAKVVNPRLRFFGGVCIERLFSYSSGVDHEKVARELSRCSST